MMGNIKEMWEINRIEYQEKNLSIRNFKCNYFLIYFLSTWWQNMIKHPFYTTFFSKSRFFFFFKPMVVWSYSSVNFDRQNWKEQQWFEGVAERRSSQLTCVFLWTPSHSGSEWQTHSLVPLHLETLPLRPCHSVKKKHSSAVITPWIALKPN